MSAHEGTTMTTAREDLRQNHHYGPGASSRRHGLCIHGERPGDCGLAIPTTRRVLDEVGAERDRQEAKWGQQDHPNGTGGEPGAEPFGYGDAADLADWLAYPEPGNVAGFMRHRCEVMFAQGGGTYEAILTEEWGEAVSEADPAKLRAELVQLAAVAVAWVEKIDRDLARKA